MKEKWIILIVWPLENFEFLTSCSIKKRIENTDDGKCCDNRWMLNSVLLRGQIALLVRTSLAIYQNNYGFVCFRHPYFVKSKCITFLKCKRIIINLIMKIDQLWFLTTESFSIIIIGDISCFLTPIDGNCDVIENIILVTLWGWQF